MQSAQEHPHKQTHLRTWFEKHVLDESLFAFEFKIEGYHCLFRLVTPSGEVHFLNMTKVVAQTIQSSCLLFEPRDDKIDQTLRLLDDPKN